MGLGKLADWYIGKLVDWKTGRLGKMKEKQWRSIIDERELEIKTRDPGYRNGRSGRKKMGRGSMESFYPPWLQKCISIYSHSGR